MVAIAQLVEPQLVKLSVAGSSPVGHPNFCTTTRRGKGNVCKTLIARFDSVVVLHLDASKRRKYMT